ncbi:ras-related protein Rab-10-like isoform X5 [Falco naumanni]|uniref:ras-related protein Rab-10-like isoform X5 n=1 Tax=Falco naumanni TaxID=148594 RepID=UPI001ADE9305|nr:ras-related protein Rab-10-like isoform X5 [Falco naumanni]
MNHRDLEVRTGKWWCACKQFCIDFKVKPVTFNDMRVKLQIWDTAGQERFHTLSTSYFRGAQGFVLVYDITNLDSFQSITSWMKDIHEKAGDEVDVILLGNKCDKESERAVPKQKGEKLAWEHGIPFFETSAKDNVNIEDAFSVLTKEILEKLEKISAWSYRAHTAVMSFLMLLKQVVVQWSIGGKNTLTCAGH